MNSLTKKELNRIKNELNLFQEDLEIINILKKIKLQIAKIEREEKTQIGYWSKVSE